MKLLYCLNSKFILVLYVKILLVFNIYLFIYVILNTNFFNENNNIKINNKYLIFNISYKDVIKNEKNLLI